MKYRPFTKERRKIREQWNKTHNISWENFLQEKEDEYSRRNKIITG